jgi:hypothetical protein
MRKNLFKRKMMRGLAASLGAIAFSSSAYVANAVTEQQVVQTFANMNYEQLNTGESSTNVLENYSIQKLNNALIKLNNLNQQIRFSANQNQNPGIMYTIQINDINGNRIMDAKLAAVKKGWNLILLPPTYDGQNTPNVQGNWHGFGGAARRQQDLNLLNPWVRNLWQNYLQNLGNAANNQQNVANNQQIVANNQQIVANNQQIVANNQQIVANNQQNVVNNQQNVANNANNQQNLGIAPNNQQNLGIGADNQQNQIAKDVVNAKNKNKNSIPLPLLTTRQKNGLTIDPTRLQGLAAVPLAFTPLLGLNHMQTPQNLPVNEAYAPTTADTTIAQTTTTPLNPEQNLTTFKGNQNEGKH